jgi:hypothetical protein
MQEAQLEDRHVSNSINLGVNNTLERFTLALAHDYGSADDQAGMNPAAFMTGIHGLDLFFERIVFFILDTMPTDHVHYSSLYNVVQMFCEEAAIVIINFSKVQVTDFVLLPILTATFDQVTGKKRAKPQAFPFENPPPSPNPVPKSQPRKPSPEIVSSDESSGKLVPRSVVVPGD